MTLYLASFLNSLHHFHSPPCLPVGARHGTLVLPRFVPSVHYAFGFVATYMSSTRMFHTVRPGLIVARCQFSTGGCMHLGQ